MPSLLPALRGRLGSTEFFLVTMKVRELVDKATIPRELEGWHDLTVEEKYQREIDLKRVRKLIAPYLANDGDRFFGSIIIAIMNSESLEFEPITDVAKGLPALYKQASAGIGMLSLSGGEVLVPLDGQHRLKALKYAITGRDDEGTNIEEITSPSIELAQEDVAVILVRYDPEKARKIFNKVNRYAKPTSKGQNLVTDDDDVIAVLTRQLVDEIFQSRMVQLQSNTLSKKAPEFTTLSTLYEANKKILLGAGHHIDQNVRPDKTKEKVFWHEIQDIWNSIISGIECISAVLYDREPSGDNLRREMRETMLLGKPVAQLAMIGAYLLLQHSGDTIGPVLSHEDICKRLNAIDWSSTAKHWQRVIMNGDKILSGGSVVALASEYIAYLAGLPMENASLQKLTTRYRGLFPLDEQASVTLPERQFKP
jgi:DNA sulfur modification protein DndB